MEEPKLHLKKQNIEGPAKCNGSIFMLYVSLKFLHV